MGALDSKISALPGPLTVAALADLLAITDDTDLVTKKIRVGDQFARPVPIGSTTPNTGKFTVLELTGGGGGTSVNEFSTDGTLGGNSDDALPTEKAVKTYVDAQIATVSSVIVNPVSVTSDSTADIGDVILADTTTGNVNVTLEATQTGRIEVKKTTNDANSVVIIPNVGTIDGNPQYILDVYNQSVSLIFDGSNYFIV